MRSSVLLGLALVAAGCGGKETVSAGPSPDSLSDSMHDAGGSGSFAKPSAPPTSGPSPGVGPFDASGLPTELAMICEGKTQIAIKLPCSVGLSLIPSARGTRDGAGVNATECELSSSPAVFPPMGRPPILALLIPLGAVEQRLNQPFAIPGEIPPAPSLALSLDGESFTMATIAGTATFSQVDPARAFVGELQDAKIEWTGAQGSVVACSATNQPFWGV